MLPLLVLGFLLQQVHCQYVPDPACLKACVPTNHTLIKICPVTDQALKDTYTVAAGQGYAFTGPCYWACTLAAQYVGECGTTHSSPKLTTRRMPK